ncbi:MAG: MBL fold metallo-hydrolase [Pseudomonadota bacterium]
MADKLVFTILGCGSSGGVPRLGNLWGSCDPNNPKNMRRRCSLLIQRIGKKGKTQVLIDTSPDMRSQLLDTQVGALDAVVYTHEHADHVHGLDDLRMIVFNMRKRITVYAAPSAKSSILSRFNYAFQTPPGSDYPPILEMRDLPDDLSIEGDGGKIDIHSFDVTHGNITVRAIKVNNVLYTPDISAIISGTEVEFKDLDTWIIDALRKIDHPSHFSFTDALEHIDRFKPEHAILTNMHFDLDFAEVEQITPDHVTPAYDLMRIERDIH